jgi:hypothetical protein
MFILSEYVLCVLVVLMLGVLLLVACGIGYILKATGIVLIRALRGLANSAPAQKRVVMGFNTNVAYARAEPPVIAECPS